MKASELEPGMDFRLPRKRKYSTVQKVVELFPNPGFVPDHHKDHVLIVLVGCGQRVLHKNQEVEVLAS